MYRCKKCKSDNVLVVYESTVLETYNSAGDVVDEDHVDMEFQFGSCNDCKHFSFEEKDWKEAE